MIADVSLGTGLPLLLSLIISVSLLSSAGHLALEKPLETALLLSLGGVGCIVLNQWHSSLQKNTHNMDNVLDGRFCTSIRNYIPTHFYQFISYIFRCNHVALTPSLHTGFPPPVIPNLDVQVFELESDVQAFVKHHYLPAWTPF